MYTNQILNHIYNNHETISKLTTESVSYYLCKYRRLTKTTLNKYPKKKILNSLNNLYIFTADSESDKNIENLSEEIAYILTKLWNDDYSSLFYNNILSITLNEDMYNYLSDFIPKSLFTLNKDEIDNKTIYSIEISIDESLNNIEPYDLCGFNIDVINEFHKLNMSNNKNELTHILFNMIHNEPLNNISKVNEIMSYIFNITISYINSIGKNKNDINNIIRYFASFVLLYNKIIKKFPHDTHEIYRFYLNYIARVNEMICNTTKDTNKYIALLNFKNLLIRSADKLKGDVINVID